MAERSAGIRAFWPRSIETSSKQTACRQSADRCCGRSFNRVFARITETCRRSPRRMPRRPSQAPKKSWHGSSRLPSDTSRFALTRETHPAREGAVSSVLPSLSKSSIDNPVDHPASPRRCRSRNSLMNSARLRPSCRRASCNEARMAAASSAEGCDARHSSTNSSRLVVSREWRSLSAAKTANWRISSSVAGILKTPLSNAVFAQWVRCFQAVSMGKIDFLRNDTCVHVYGPAAACQAGGTSAHQGTDIGRRAASSNRPDTIGEPASSCSGPGPRIRSSSA